MPNYDPKLRKTVEEIKWILEREDFAGIVIAISESHAEFRITFPRWGVITLKRNELRFKSDKKDFHSRDEQHKAIESSVHVIFQMADLLSLNFKYIDKMKEMLEDKFEIDHKPLSDFYPA